MKQPGPVPPGAKIWRAGTLVYTSGGLATLFFFLLFGDFAMSMRDRSVGPMVHWYLNHLGIPNSVYAILLHSFPALLGMVLGPIISFKSDRLRSRWGRRIPFLLVSTPIAAFGMIGVGGTPLIAKWLHGHFPKQNEVVIAVLCFGVFWTAFEIAAVVAGSVFGGLVNDVVPKTLLGRFFGLFRAISLIDGMIFNFWIMGKVPRYFTSIFIAIGLFYGIAFLWVCFKVKEGNIPLPPQPTASGPGSNLISRFKDGVATYFRECFTSSYYILVFLFMMLAILSFGPVNTFAIPYANSLGVSMDTYGKFVALTYLISLCLSFFLGWLADLFHPLRMAIAALSGYALVSAWGAAFATTPNTYLTALVLNGVVSGCYYSGVASLGLRLFPHSRYAQFHSASAVLGALAGLFLTPTVGLIIDSSGRIYRYAFAASSTLSILALICGIFVYGKFRKLGGFQGYEAPE